MFNPLKVRLMRSVCGLDVHKDSVYLCILSEDGELIEKVFGVLTFQLHQMRDLLLAHHVEKVSMESTSVYWIPIWRILAPHFHLQLVNPYFIKQLPGHKSDVADAQWIAECTMKNLISSSFVPPEDIQQLRQYDRRIFDLDEEIVRKLSKLDAVMQRCNIRLSNYVSNVDCKSYKDVVRKISEGVTDPEIHFGTALSYCPHTEASGVVNWLTMNGFLRWRIHFMQPIGRIVCDMGASDSRIQ